MANEWNKQNQKPLGVYILTIAIFLRFGIFQFFSQFFNLRESDNEIPLLIVIVLLSLSAFTALSAVWAFVGDNLGRIFFLALLSLNILWEVFSTILTISYNEKEFNAISFELGLFQPSIWLVVCWWYFARKKVIDYYEKD